MSDMMWRKIKCIFLASKWRVVQIGSAEDNEAIVAQTSNRIIEKFARVDDMFQHLKRTNDIKTFRMTFDDVRQLRMFNRKFRYFG